MGALARAERLRARALKALAVLPVGETGSGFALPTELQRLLQPHHKRLTAAEGYRGHALGWKNRDGIVDASPSVTVFVRKKLSKQQLSRAPGQTVPGWLKTTTGSKIQTDVVELEVERKDRVTPGASIGPRQGDKPGTLACFAWDAKQQFVGLTAGHVAQGATRYVTPARNGIEFGFLDSLSLSPVDAATIVVTSGWSQILPNGSHIIGARQLTAQDLGQPVYVYGAHSGGWSPGIVHYLASWITNWNLADAIVYSSSTLPGDSGGPVIDQYGYLVGVHVGRGLYQGRGVAIAGAIGRVAHELKITPAF